MQENNFLKTNRNNGLINKCNKKDKNNNNKNINKIFMPDKPNN